MYTARVCALCLLLLDFLTSSSSSRCANKKQRGVVFFDGGEKSLLCCFVLLLFSSIKNQKNASIFVFSKTHNLHAIHTLFLRIVSARNLLLSSERDTASGIYAYKEVRAL